MPHEIYIDYDARSVRGRLKYLPGEGVSLVWERLMARFAGNAEVRRGGNYLDMPWPEVLGVVREFGSKPIQRDLNFRIRVEPNAKAPIQRFIEETGEARNARGRLVEKVLPSDVQSKLTELGFSRELRDFQKRDLAHLMSLSHGANFSVPGAGKTTVTFALSLLVQTDRSKLLVIAPKAAFPAWKGVVGECMGADASVENRQSFLPLDGTEQDNAVAMSSGARRFIMSYDLMIRQQGLVASFLSRYPTHLVLDESHRMKAGQASQRGAFLINVASLASRRDILSGTPMPQEANDMASQLGFLWPAQGYDREIQQGQSPKAVLGSLYVRTTKDELGLTPAQRHFVDVDMSKGQLALYGVVRSEILRQLTKSIKDDRGPDFLRARKSVMRLLQLSANPTLALQAMASDYSGISSGVANQVVEEGASEKMRAVCAHARQLSRAGEKVVIWTIFTQSILDLERLLSDLNPVVIHGGVPSGDEDDISTREGRLKAFHDDKTCRVIIANPAAAGEGISLHRVCHNAIYLDRSYVSTHYLQSIDRIHRLGLPKGVETHIHVYRTRAPAGLGSVDLSVSRRLATKIRNLQALLDDDDLHRLALDEEDADDPIDYDVDLQDLVDLVSELEGRHSGSDDEA